MNANVSRLFRDSYSKIVTERPQYLDTKFTNRENLEKKLSDKNGPK